MRSGDGQRQEGAFAISRGKGEQVWFLGTLVTILATGKDTSEAYGLIEQLAPPGFGPPPHSHADTDEQFYILEGDWIFFSGDRQFSAGPGSFVYFPRGEVHAFRLQSTEPGRLLQLNTPAGFEHFFVEMGEPAAEAVLPPPAPPDADKMLTMAAKYVFTLGSRPSGEPV